MDDALSTLKASASPLGPGSPNSGAIPLLVSAVRRFRCYYPASALGGPQRFKIILHQFHDEFVVAGAAPAIAIEAAHQHLAVVVDFSEYPRPADLWRIHAHRNCVAVGLSAFPPFMVRARRQGSCQCSW